MERSRAIVMLAVATVEPAVRIPQSQANSMMWWYVARASGAIALVFLGISVIIGLLLSARFTRRRPRIQGLHESLGAFAVIFTALHLTAVFSATQLRIGLRELLVPFARPDNPVAQGCGVLACYLLAAVVLTSWARALLPWRWWRRVHLLALPTFSLACAHTVLAGSDVRHPIVRWVGLVAGVGIVFLAVARLLTARSTRVASLAAENMPGREVFVSRSLRSVNPPPAQTGMRLLIGQTTWEADNVVSLRLYSPDGAPLPSWEPGAHIELALSSGRRRQYSLCGEVNDNRCYRIAILQVPGGRGGSVEVHTGARVGRLVTVRGPRNHFPLLPSPAYLFIAGGIGITAILAMATHLAASGEQWNLLYAGRRRASMAFLDEVSALGPEWVEVMPADERGRPDLKAIIGAAAPGTAVYCCGPDRMLRAVRAGVAARPDLSLHSEPFTGTGTLAGTSGGALRVELRRTGRVITVPAERTILAAVRDVVPAVSAGCEQGVCGACRATVLAGEADHRDELLTSAERGAGTMLICVSRARGERLTLDL